MADRLRLMDRRYSGPGSPLVPIAPAMPDASTTSRIAAARARSWLSEIIDIGENTGGSLANRAGQERALA